jgi:hypothetical protein
MRLIETGLIVAGGAAAAFAGVKIYKKYSRKKVEKAAHEKAREEFAACADVFSGLYEPLYMMGKGGLKFRTGIIGDWATRTVNLAGASNYQDMWIIRFSDYSSWNQEQGMAKINELLSFVFAAGVCRDTAAQITVDSTTYKKYNTSDDEMVEEGSPASVKTPYWFIEDKILEKGVIEKI